MTIKILNQAPPGKESEGYYLTECHTRTHIDSPFDVGIEHSQPNQLFLTEAERIARIHDKINHRGHGDLQISWHGNDDVEEIFLESATDLLHERKVRDESSTKEKIQGDEYEDVERKHL